MSQTISQAAINPYSQQEASVRTLVQAVGNLADRHQFEDLEQLYAAQVLLDYQSLSGEAPKIVTADSLMTQ